MKLATSLFVLCLGLIADAGHGAGPKLTVPVARNLAAVRATGRCIAADLLHGTTGVLLQGTSAARLPAGCYLLHVPLALAPLGDLRISAVTVTITAGDATRAVTMLHFPVADEFVDLPLAFTAPGGQTVPIAVTWAIVGDQAKKNRDRAALPPKAPGEEDALKSDLTLVEDDGPIAIADLKKTACHLAAGDLWIEPQGPLAITAVRTDKIVYRPGEEGVATVTVKNCGAGVAQSAVTVAVLCGLSSRRPAGSAVLEIPPGESRDWTGPFSTAGLHWGAELQASVRAGDGPEAASRAIFGVTDNFWEISINAGMMFSTRYIDPKDAEQFVQGLRDDGYTQMESGFWAPDEFGCFNPKQDLFFGGQGSYAGSVRGTKNVLAALHKRGMRGTVYANLWGGDGYESYEQMRRHPDWFTAGGGASTDWMENWPLMFKKKIPPIPVWPYTVVIEPDLMPPLRWHADELIRTHRKIGWDGVRYDSYDSMSDATIKSTKIVRELVEAEETSFRWGYNASVPKDVKPESLDIMCRGGQLVMEEALGRIGQSPSSFAQFLLTLAGYRDTVWQHDGHLGLCNGVPASLRGGTLLDRLHMCCFLLAAGCHPYYGRMDRTLGDFPGFALRYSEILYNNKMRPMPEPEKVVSFGGNPSLFHWTRLAQQVDLGEGRRRLVLHLLSPPADDLTLHNPALKTSAPIRDLPVTLALPAGVRAPSAWALTPMSAAQQVALAPQTTGGTVTLSVPEVRFWTVLVVEYTEVKP